MAAYGTTTTVMSLSPLKDLNSYLLKISNFGGKIKSSFSQHYLRTPDSTVYAHVCDKSFPMCAKCHVRECGGPQASEQQRVECEPDGFPLWRAPASLGFEFHPPVKLSQLS